MKQDKKYTTEHIRKRFDNQFQLVNYAIKLAEKELILDEEARRKIVNPTLKVISELSKGGVQDQLKIEP